MRLSVVHVSTLAILSALSRTRGTAVRPARVISALLQAMDSLRLLH